MWYAINERNAARTKNYHSEDELIAHLREVSKSEADFWDVYMTTSNEVQYYW